MNRQKKLRSAQLFLFAMCFDSLMHSMDFLYSAECCSHHGALQNKFGDIKAEMQGKFRFLAVSFFL